MSDRELEPVDRSDWDIWDVICVDFKMNILSLVHAVFPLPTQDKIFSVEVKIFLALKTFKGSKWYVLDLACEYKQMHKVNN